MIITLQRGWVVVVGCWGRRIIRRAGVEDTGCTPYGRKGETGDEVQLGRSIVFQALKARRGCRKG